MIQSPIGWVGGKQRLRAEILNRFPKNFECYIEAFAGGLWVLFGKEPRGAEVVNDINGDLVNFWMQLQMNPEGLGQMAAKLLTSRQIFTMLLKCPPELLEPIPRAVRFYYLNKTSFGCKGTIFGTSTGRTSRFDPQTVMEKFQIVAKRLAKVVIERLDFEKLIQVYDRPHTFFYLDPPYLLGPGYYAFEFTMKDHERLAKALRNTTGKWILSYNDHPDIKRLYKGFKTERLSTRYRLHDHVRDKVSKELLIRNF